MAKTEEWLKKAEKELENAKEKGQVSESVVGLVSELRIHQAELEMQNEELRKSHEEQSELYNRYYELFDNAPVAYFTLDKNGIIRNVNVKGAELLQLKKNQIIGFGFSKFIPKDYEGKYFQSLADAIDTGENQKLELQLKRNKTLSYTQMEVMPLISDESYRIVITDITDRKKAEEALNQIRDNLEEQVKERTLELELANAYNRSLIEASLDPLVTIGPDGKINDVNTATELVTGYSRDELIGTDFSKYFTKPSKAKFGYQKVFREGEVRDYPLQIRHKNGHITPVVYNASVYRDESGKVIGVFAAARDITKIKKSEAQLKQLIKELERSNDELQQFAYISSHDLQEPLRTIASFTQLLERRYKGQLDSDADEFIDFIVEAAKRMKQQIQDLLEFSRVETKGEELEPVDMGSIAKQVVQSLNSSVDECKAEILIDELPIVTGDAGQLQRVFQNLISNALKFRKPDEPPKIHISAYKSDDGKEYVFSVADIGIGIEEQYFDRIFTIFQQLHTMSEYKGTGIGLAIVKRIIERHGGNIWVESEYGRGSTFYFTIPVSSIDAVKN